MKQVNKQFLKDEEPSNVNYKNERAFFYEIYETL
jgi:hypothetical protein